VRRDSGGFRMLNVMQTPPETTTFLHGPRDFFDDRDAHRRMSTVQSARSQELTAGLLLGWVLAGPLFVLVFSLDGATRPGYVPMTMPVSLLAVGDRGWVQTLNFLVDGVLLAAFTVGLFRVLRDRGTPSIAGPVLIGIVALGVLGAAIFATDPGGGFPPGVPPPSLPSSHGELHDLASLLVFVGLPIACLTFAARFARWGERSWALYSLITGLILVVTFVGLVVGFDGWEGLVLGAGLVQRLFIVVGWGWIAALALHLRRSIATGS
jgi:hypothetical protein